MRKLSGPLINDGVVKLAIKLIGKGDATSASDLEEFLTGARDGSRLMEINYTICDCQGYMKEAVMSVPKSALYNATAKRELEKYAKARKKSRASAALASALVKALINNARDWVAYDDD